MNQKDLEVAVAQAMAKQAAQQRATGGGQQLQVIQNGGVNQAVNFAAEDFVKAAAVLKTATKDYTVAHSDLLPGVQSFVQQQFFRMNSAGQLLDALGYQGVTEVLAYLHRPAIDYIRTTMEAWNKVINDEGEVKKIWDSIGAEEAKEAAPPATMQ